MECNKDEAVRAKGLAEEKMLKNDFEGARKIALKARNLFPELDNISQLISVCEVHCSAQKKIYGAEKDLYGILQVEKIADEATIRKQYRKLALVLHPDKNKFPGAEAAFKLIGEANMILSDKGKRSIYDIKCREPARASVTKLQHRQGNQSSYASTHFAAQNKFNNVPSSQFNGNNHQQQSTSHSSSHLSFWTYCPFCNIKYEYYREFLNRPLRCQHCSKLFIAYDIGAQGPAPRPGFVHEQKAQPHVFQQESGKQEKVKVNIQNNGQFSHQTSRTGVQFAQHTKMEDPKVGSTRTNHESGKEGVKNPKVNVQKSMEPGTSKDANRKRGRKVEAEFSGSGSDVEDACGGTGVSPVGDGVSCRRSSRQRQKVSYCEDAGDELSHQKRSRLKKSSSDVEDVKKEEVSSKVDQDLCNQKASAHADVNMPNGNNMEKRKVKVEEAVTPDEHSNSELDSSDSEPELVDCLEPEFSNFDKDKEVNCFAVDQIWACYDSVDGMPRFYAHVRKIYSSDFRMRFTWLEAKPENEPEIKWADEGLPVACGMFVHGETEITRDRLMFSHQMAVEKCGTRFSYVIRPQKGEIWALFKNWDIKWSLDPESHRKYKFDIVEILSVQDNSISVSFLLKVKGFVSLFQRTSGAESITSNELFRFSHRIPSVKLSGTERAGVPAGSFELDPAALPSDLEEYYCSKEVKLEPEKFCSYEEKVEMTPKKHVNSKAENGLDSEMLKLRRSPRGLKNQKSMEEVGSEQSNGVKYNVIDAAPSKSHVSFGENGVINTISKKLTKSPGISSPCGKLERIIHDFSADKVTWKFQVSQILAFWEHDNGIRQRYARIKQIQSDPFRLHVSLLTPCNIPSNSSVRHKACGLFKVSAGRMKILSPDSFSHIVQAEASVKNIYNIYPREQQIWALYKGQDADNLEGSECEVVQVLETDESSVKVLSLTRVPGYKSVYKAPRIQRSSARILVIPRIDLINRFSHQIPAFLFREEKDLWLRGCWELDPAALAGVHLVGCKQG